MAEAKEVVPSHAKIYGCDIETIAIYRGRIFFKHLMENEGLQPCSFIAHINPDGGLGARLSCAPAFQPSGRIICMEVKFDYLYVLAKIPDLENDQESRDHIFAFDLENCRQRLHIKVKQKGPYRDWSTMAVGTNCIYCLELETWNILGYDMLKNPLAHSYILQSLDCQGADVVQIHSSTVDHILIVEIDQVIHGAHMQQDRLIWKLEISARDSFRCFNQSGFHLIAERREMVIIDPTSGESLQL